MDIKKIIGYVLSVIGLAGIIVSSGPMKDNVPIVKDMAGTAVLGFAAVFVVAGVLILIISARFGSSSKQPREVPIYEGRGKKQKIVAYQRMSKK